jgi:uroporphyrinogen-III synthase
MTGATPSKPFALAKPCALVTRPREDSAGLTAELRSRGLEVMVEPLLDIVPVEGASVDAAGAQAILATSANGIRAFARLHADRSLPVLAVGDASARAALALGFTRVDSAGGDVDTLVNLVRNRIDPAAGVLLHAAGSVTAGDLSGSLAALGYGVRRLVLYQAVTAVDVSPALHSALTTSAVDLALFFSPRTAATFVTLIGSAGLGASVGRIHAYALSANVARTLSALPWRRLTIAADPTQAALLAALDDDLQREGLP